MSAPRRLAAILAVDVVGYSRLMGEDEARTARAVREEAGCTPLIPRWRLSAIPPEETFADTRIHRSQNRRAEIVPHFGSDSIAQIFITKLME
jgi:hypothetical protein